MDPPAVEVFGDDATGSVIESESAAPMMESEPSADPEPSVAETSESFDDPASQAASLRDEIAQWRAESSRRSTDSEEADARAVASPRDEILADEEDSDTTSDLVEG
jgi:hypothetical protein